MNALLTDGIAGRLEKIIQNTGATAAGIGMPGLRSAGQATDLSQALSGRAGCPVLVTDDGDVARAGAFGGAPGIIVIAGTGSAAVGWDGRRRVQAGGHGFLLGDEGSAYWIGQSAARTALHWQDGIGGSAALHRAVTETAGCTLDELIIKVNTHSAERSFLAVLAPRITDLAATDQEARRIAERAADHLADLVAAIRRRLGPLPSGETLPSGEALPCAGTGGVFRAPLIWDRFAGLTGATRPQASPAVGAALLAAGSVHGWPANGWPANGWPVHGWPANG
jgi:N-acetylglucosamine kinase-like BadF-type ATPase